MVQFIQILLPTPIKGIEIIAIHESVECENPEIIDIFNYYKNQKKYGLTDKVVTLYEERLREGINGWTCGNAQKIGEKEYDICINLENIDRCRELGERYISLEYVIRHELNHIRFGDCDKKLPYYLDKLHRNLIAEPRAHIAASFNL